MPTIKINIAEEIARQTRHLVKYDEIIEDLAFTKFTALYHLNGGKEGRNSRTLEEGTKFNLVAGAVAGPDYFQDIIKKVELRQKEIPVQMKHSQYSIQWHTALREMNIPKMKVIGNLVKANASDMEYYLSEMVACDLCEEGWYKNRVDKLMNEIKSMKHIHNILEKQNPVVRRF